ncbi:unnamed protein product [Bursaphelenchus xylophilus]|uniref:(pine wood nematode) hypothetical protein n=1 Tax=Bursaphelenchus xylophilus TaxID=6326 RepID=A0A1I7S4C2_BURXY|nr:unnamed protein product [Bursaphelenchus xylophilus]CAG9116941.1 unnamed protein product [Bursaphelenchus xylophilus]
MIDLRNVDVPGPSQEAHVFVSPIRRPQSSRTTFSVDASSPIPSASTTTSLNSTLHRFSPMSQNNSTSQHSIKDQKTRTVRDFIKQIKSFRHQIREAQEPSNGSRAASGLGNPKLLINGTPFS